MSQERQRLKEQLHEAHRRVFDGVLAAVAGIGPDDWHTPTGCPGWDVHDQLAHIVGVERNMLGDPPDEVELPAELPHVRNDFGRAVELAVAARRGLTPEELVDEARTTFDRRLAALDRLDPATLGEPLDGPAGMRMKASQMLRTRIFDLVTHEHDIRRALGRPGATEGPQVDIAVEQVLRAWAKLVPRRREGGGVLAVEVAGRDPVLIDLAAGELQRGGTGPTPAATVHLDVPGLLAVGGGRTDAPGPDDLAITGDRTFAREVLAVATITP